MLKKVSNRHRRRNISRFRGVVRPDDVP